MASLLPALLDPEACARASKGELVQVRRDHAWFMISTPPIVCSLCLISGSFAWERVFCIGSTCEDQNIACPSIPCRASSITLQPS